MTDQVYPKKIADNVTMYAADPILYVVDNFLSNDECDAFIKASEGKLQPSTVISPGQHIQHESRTSENCWIQHDANDIVHEASKRFSVWCKCQLEMQSSINLFITKKVLNISRILIHLTMKQRMEKITGSQAAKE